MGIRKRILLPAWMLPACIRKGGTGSFQTTPRHFDHSGYINFGPILYKNKELTLWSDKLRKVRDKVTATFADQRLGRSLVCPHHVEDGDVKDGDMKDWDMKDGDMEDGGLNEAARVLASKVRVPASKIQVLVPASKVLARARLQHSRGSTSKRTRDGTLHPSRTPPARNRLVIVPRQYRSASNLRACTMRYIPSHICGSPIKASMQHQRAFQYNG